jgi:hypothetical protein
MANMRPLALKSMDEIYAKLEDAAPYIERDPTLVESITSFPTSQSHSDLETVTVLTPANAASDW